MLTNPMLEQMQTLGLAGMAAAYRQLAEQDNTAALSRDEWLGLMLDREVAVRADRRLTNRLAAASCASLTPASKISTLLASVASIDATSCNSRKALGCRPKRISSSPAKPGPAKPGWPVPSPAKRRASIIPVLYLRVPRLFENLAMARLDGRYPRLVDSPVSNCWSSTIGAPTASMISSASISWKSSRSATAENPS